MPKPFEAWKIAVALSQHHLAVPVQKEAHHSRTDYFALRSSACPITSLLLSFRLEELALLTQHVPFIHRGHLGSQLYGLPLSS